MDEEEKDSVVWTDEDDWFEHYRWVVDAGQNPLRIDKFLFLKMERTSRNRIQKAAETHCVRVNDKPVKSNYRVKPGDLIQVMFPNPPRSRTLEPENIPLDICYEDEHLIVLNKPAGLVVHPGVGNHGGTLVNALLYHFSQLPVSTNPQGDHGESMRPGLIHRLDKDTSGILVVAKTEEAMTLLARQFFERTTERRYVALVWGNVAEDAGRIEGHIARDPRDRQLFRVFPDGSQGKHAVTHYRVLERFGFVTLVECKLETGRTHQIRVHMKYMGHTLFNDVRYGGDKPLKGYDTQKYRQFIANLSALIPGQALHAKSLGFTHPATGEWKYFESPLPPGFEEILNRWRTYMASHQPD